MICQICPRKCTGRAADSPGFCGASDTMRIARISLHPYEEPCISGSHGSGTIFFSGCNLKCVFCQNAAIRDGAIGTPFTSCELTDAILKLQSDGAHNINLVTATPHLNGLVQALKDAKRNGLSIPVVYNTSAYESLETIDRLEGLVDVYLPDLKFRHPALADRFCHSPDYFPTAIAAITRMLEQVGHLCLNMDGLAQHGLLIRHLVLPNCVFDTREILQEVAARYTTACHLSVMRQYTPPDNMEPPLNRTITDREYRSVIDCLLQLGFSQVYLQEAASVGFRYTPHFSENAPLNSQEYMS